MTSPILKFPRGIRFWCQVASKQMGKTFPWGKSTKVKCHMSGEGISNLICNRQKWYRRINWPSENSGVNTEKDPKTRFLEKLSSPTVLLGFQSSPVVKCLHLLLEKDTKWYFHPLQKNLCFHEFSVRPNMSSLLLSVTKGGIFQLSLLEQSMFSHYFMSVSPILSSCFYWTLWIFSAQIAHIQNPLDCRPDDWARE